jgi:hypothetical protein
MSYEMSGDFKAPDFPPVSIPRTAEEIWAAEESRRVQELEDDERKKQKERDDKLANDFI